MPGGNRTGPAGMGPMTGRGAGVCAGARMPGFANAGGGRCFFGRGRGMGCGRGFGCGFGWVGAGNAGAYPVAQPLTNDQELEGLKGQAEYLEGSLKQIMERIDELQSGEK